MKKKRRIALILPALCLCVILVVSALAEGALGTLYRAAAGLMFDTDNATLTVHADFTYNGLPFKTLDGLYKQDGVNSLLDLKLKTPKRDGSVFDSGFTVVGNGDTAYAIDPVDNPYVYSTSAMAPSTSILSGNTLRRALVRLGAAVVDVTEGSFADMITMSTDENGTQYHIQTKEGQAPALVNAAGTVFAQLAAERLFNIDYGYWGQAERPTMNTPYELNIMYDDYWETFGAYYQREYGEPLPEDFYAKLWGDDAEAAAKAQERYEKIQDILYEDLTAPLQASYDRGVALIHGDGSVDYYPTSDQYYVENDLLMVDYADYDACFRSYYQKATGDELTADELQALYYTDNEELMEAVNKIFDQMNEEYLNILRADGKAALIYVNTDGSYRMVYDYDAYLAERTTFDGVTVTRRILNSMDALELGDCDFTVHLDKENRITDAQGTASLVVIDAAGHRGHLEVEFDCSADHYGDTEVKAFDPADYGVMTWGEYMSRTDLHDFSDEAEHVPDLPETIMFAGVQYQLILDEENDADK